MRPLEEVLAEAYHRAFPDNCEYEGMPSVDLRRDLEEWEALLSSECAMSSNVMPAAKERLGSKLREIRRLLGRSEPVVWANPGTISQTTAHKLMEACEKLCVAWHTARSCNEIVTEIETTLAQARAELAGEANP